MVETEWTMSKVPVAWQVMNDRQTVIAVSGDARVLIRVVHRAGKAEGRSRSGQLFLLQYS